MIRQRANYNENISKQRETVETTFRFEVGVFAESLANRGELQDKLRNLFLFEDIPVFDSEGLPTGIGTQAHIDAETPISADDISSDTKKHRMYFSVEIYGSHHKNRRR